MSERQRIIADTVKGHVVQILKSNAYPAVWNQISESTMDSIIEAVSTSVVDAVLRDPTIEEVLSQTQLFTSTGKLNAIAIHKAIVQAAQSVKDPLQTKLTHLAKNAEIVFRSARLFKEAPPHE